MPEFVCLCCLTTVDSDQMVIENSHDVYHSDCFERLQNLKKNKVNNELPGLEDVTDCIVLDPSDNLFKYNLKNYEEDKPIGKYIDLTNDEKILSPYYIKKNYEPIQKIIDGPDFATDIAGNFVKLDKSYLITNELEKIKKIKF